MSVEITFRTLKGGTFKLSASATDSILDVKKKVGAEQNVEDYPAYRLIYKGKILADDATVTSAGISSAGFVVVMPPKKAIAKPNPAEPAKPTDVQKNDDESTTSSVMDTTPAPVATAAAAAATTKAPDATTAAAATATAAAAAASTASGESSADGASALVTGAAYETSVNQIVEMGFPEADVKKALRAAFNNPQRAVDYLFNGIPESAAPAPTPPPAAPRSAPTQTASAATATATATPAPGGAALGTPFNMFEAPAAGGGGAGGGQGGTGNLDFLRGLPQFNMMRRLIQANPNVLPQILQQLEETNPSLLAMIDANQVEFTRLINEPLRDGEDGGDDEVMEHLAQAMAGAGGPGTGQPGPGQIYVTEEEHEQIVRLSELGATIGLEESHVVETWLACNRDETLAANFLVDHAEELRADTQRNSANAPNPPDAPDAGEGGPPS